MRAAPLPPLTSIALAAATALFGLGASAALVFGTESLESVRARTPTQAPPQPRGEPPPPSADAPREEQLAGWRERCEFLQRRLERNQEAFEALKRTEAQLDAGAHPEGGREKLAERRTKLSAALERDRAELERALSALQALESGSTPTERP
jgi:hypothetical protein